MNLDEFWNKFLEHRPDLAQVKMADAWSFGGNADHLLSLVLEGKKTATCSLISVYEDGSVPVPVVGTYSVITNSRGVPGCVIHLFETFQAKFKNIDEKHAYEEGEGDRTLSYWREIHRKFFSNYPDFSEDSELLCERFKVVWKP